MTALVALDTIPTGLVNRAVNGAFTYNPEGSATGADGSTCFGVFTRLSQSASTTTSQLTAPDPGQACSIRITQPSATPQRIGICQTIRSVNCIDLRESTLAFLYSARLSEDARTMFAVLAWTGTADTSPADPINDWTSAAYIPGQFFKTGFQVLNFGYLSAPSAEWRSAPFIPFQSSDSMTNLVAVIWTEEVLAQNGTLDIGLFQITQGPNPLDFEHRPYALDAFLALNPVYPESDVLCVANNAALSALSGGAAGAVITQGRTTVDDGGGGRYVWQSADVSAQVTADPLGGVYVPPSGEDGSDGAWVRQFNGPLFCEWFGAVGNGSTDDTAEIQATINAAISLGVAAIQLATATYAISDTLDINSPMALIGNGPLLSQFKLTTATVDGISVTTTSPIYFEGFNIFASTGGGQTAGAMIRIDPGTGNNNNESIIRNVRWANAWDGLILRRSAYFHVDCCEANEYKRYGLQIRNDEFPDSGDHTVTKSIFVTSTATAGVYGIYYESSGGLKFIGNKVLGGYDGFFLHLQASATTADLIGVGNSIEGQTRASAHFAQQGTATFFSAQWNDNQMGGDGATYVGLLVESGGLKWLNSMTATGNVVIMGALGGGGTAFDIDGPKNFVVCNNTMQDLGGATSGVIIREFCENGIIGPNVDTTIDTKLSINASATNICVMSRSLQTVTNTFDYGSIASYNGDTTQVVGVTGAAFGDSVTVTASASQQGINLSGYVESANSVRVLAFNMTAGAIDLGSLTYYVTVTKRQGT